MEEEYKPLASLDNRYGISKQGVIKNLKTGRIISTYIGVDLYEHATLHLDGQKIRVRVHRLMAEAYLGDCEVVDHIDGNKSNNKLENLHATTHSENIKKAYQENTYKNPHAGRGIWVIAENKETGERHSYKSMRQCEVATGVDRHRIHLFLTNQRPNYTQYNFYYDE